jgi:hypothetical protein
MTELAVQNKQFDLSPQTFEQALTFSNYLSESDLVPKDFKGKPANCLIAMQWGSELGLKPLQAMQNLAIINGRPSLWGDAVLALVLASPVCEYVTESVDGDTSICKAKRKGSPEQIRTFSDADAKAAGLLGKQGPWTQYKARMRQMRARAFCLRDVFADVLRGLPVAEELMDVPEKNMGMADVLTHSAAPAAPKPTALPECSDDLFEKRLTEWHKAIADGRATAEAVIAKAATRYTLTEAQKAAIHAKPAPAAVANVSFAVVADALHKAADADALDAAADLIGEVADPAQRAELSVKYDALRAEANA